MLADAGGVLPRKACSAPIAASRAGRPPARFTSCASASARSTSSSPPLLKPAAQYWRGALLAVRSGQPMPALPAGRRGDARRPRPIRAARRSPTAASAASGSASTSPTGSPAMRARSARPAATIRSTPRSRPRSASAKTRIARLMDEVGFTRAGDAWRWRGRRPPRGDRRGRAVPRLRRAGQAQEDVRIDRYLHCIRLVKSRTLAQALIDAGHVRDRRQARRQAERGGARRSDRRAARCAAECAC